MFMKVKELISRLQALDPEKCIYTYYDMYQVQEISISVVSIDFEPISVQNGCINPVSGDYLIIAY